MQHDVMDTTLAPPTSAAATKATEPEVVAAISSGEIGPDVPTSINAGGGGAISFGQWALLLIGGAAIGYGLSRMWSRDS